MFDTHCEEGGGGGYFWWWCKIYRIAAFTYSIHHTDSIGYIKIIVLLEKDPAQRQRVLVVICFDYLIMYGSVSVLVEGIDSQTIVDRKKNRQR